MREYERVGMWANLGARIVEERPGEVVVETPDGTAFRVEADDIGLFDVAGMPRGQVRLRCQTPDGSLVTDWVCL